MLAVQMMSNLKKDQIHKAQQIFLNCKLQKKKTVKIFNTEELKFELLIYPTQLFIKWTFFLHLLFVVF